MSVVRKHNNLSNKTSEPEHAIVEMSVTVHFDMYGAVPKGKLQAWLESLPEEARITFEGMYQGKGTFTAKWKENR
jgi:hypothetical protein